MKLVHCCVIAIKNILRKNSSIKILIGLVLVSIFLLCFFIINLGFNESIKKLHILNDYDGFIVIDNQNNQSKQYFEDKINNIKGVNLICEDNSFHSNNTKVLIDYIEVSANELLVFHPIDYQNNEVPYDYELRYEHEFHDKNYLLCGSYINNSQEVIVSENLIKNWGINDAVSIIGSLITVYDNNNIFLNEMIIVGIFKNVGLLENYNRSIIFSQDIMDAEIQAAKRLIIYCDDEFRENVYNELQVLMSNYDIRLNIPDNYYSLEKIKDQRLVMNSILFMIGLIVLITIMIYIITILYYYFKRRRNFYGILCANGISRIKLYLIEVMELLILYLIALLISSLIVFFNFRLLTTEILNFLGINIYIDFSDVILIFFCSSFSGIILLNIILLISFNRIINTRIIDLLKE